MPLQTLNMKAAPSAAQASSRRGVRAQASDSVRRVGLSTLLAGVAARPAFADLPDVPEPAERLAYEVQAPSAASKLAYPGLEDASASAVSAAQSAALDLDLPAIDIDASELLSNPLLIGGAVAAVAIPLAIKAFSGSGPKVQGVSAAAAFEALAEDPSVVAIDIRNSADIKEAGSPDLRSTKKSLTSVPLSKVVKGEVVYDEEAFIAKLSKVADPEEATLLLFDTLGGESPKAAQLAAKQAGFNTVLFVKGGCDGNRGWRESELPWKEPIKIDLDFVKSLDITGVTKLADKLAQEYEENPTAVKGGLAVAAAGAAAFVLFNEMELVLEALGIWAAFQFVAKKLFFAEDRERTFTEFKVLLQDKIAAGEAGQDLKKLADTIMQSDDVAEVQEQAAEESNEDSKAVDDIAARKEEVQAWVQSWRNLPSSEKSEVVEESTDSDEEAMDDIAARKEEVQAWVQAWKERTSVTVMA